MKFNDLNDSWYIDILKKKKKKKQKSYVEILFQVELSASKRSCLEPIYAKNGVIQTLTFWITYFSLVIHQYLRG